MLTMESPEFIHSGKTSEPKLPFISLVVPVYNEEAIFNKNISLLCDYMKSLENNYRWEIIIVNDGSTDKTGKLADEFSGKGKNIRVYHHKVNLFLGSSIRTGIKYSNGDYIVVMDLDLSYSPDHIEKLVNTIIVTDAQIVVASPYMKGGKVTNVPFIRKILSQGVNYFLSILSNAKIHTFTGMVRAYEKKFISRLNLKATDFEINPEIIYKSLLLRARIIEIPANLDWTLQNSVGKKRVSSMRMFRGITSGLMSAFIFKPYLFFITVGMILGLISLYVIAWIFINTLAVYPTIPEMNGVFDDRFSSAVSMVFKERPHAFLVGGVTLIVALQILSLGFLSLQNKRYFEELFHINTNILNCSLKVEDSQYISDQSPL